MKFDDDKTPVLPLLEDKGSPWNLWVRVGLGLIVTGLLGWALMVLYPTFQGARRPTPLSPSARQSQFVAAWKADVQLMERSGRLPLGWSRIGRVEIAPASKSEWVPTRRADIPIMEKTKGDHILEVLLLGAQEDGVQHVIIQYDLLDPKGNTIAEFGRTLRLN